MLQAKLRRKVFAQCLHAIALGRMMPCGNEGDARLLRDVHILF